MKINKFININKIKITINNILYFTILIKIFGSIKLTKIIKNLLLNFK